MLVGLDQLGHHVHDQAGLLGRPAEISFVVDLLDLAGVLLDVEGHARGQVTEAVQHFAGIADLGVALRVAAASELRRTQPPPARRADQRGQGAKEQINDEGSHKDTPLHCFDATRTVTLQVSHSLQFLASQVKTSGGSPYPRPR